MKNNFLLLLALFFMTLNGFSQNQESMPDTIFMKVYDDYSNCQLTYTVKMECSDINAVNADTTFLITEQNEIQFFQDRLDNLTIIKNVYGPDVRIKLWLTINGLDSTLCFGTKNEVIEYDGQLYEYDKELIVFILGKLEKVEFVYKHKYPDIPK